MTSVISAITGVFDAISTWMQGAISAVIPIFYEAESGLTFLGVLAVMSLAISLVFLLIGVIQNFLHFRG